MQIISLTLIVAIYNMLYVVLLWDHIVQVKSSVLIRPIKRKPWEFLHEDIKLKDLLGEGQFGEVRAGEALVNGKRLSVAIKVVSLQNTLYSNARNLKSNRARCWSVKFYNQHIYYNN